jgi:hypothetical protein
MWERKELNIELFELPEVELFGFKLNDVSFLFDKYFKEKVLCRASLIYSSEDADVYLFRETSITKLNEYTYYLKLSWFYDTAIVQRKKSSDSGYKYVNYNIVKKEGERILNIPFNNILSAYERGIIIFEFDIYKEEMFILETRFNNLFKLTPFKP